MDIYIWQIFSALSQTKFILGEKIGLPVKKLRRTSLPPPTPLVCTFGCNCVCVCVCDGTLNFMILRVVNLSLIRAFTVYQRFWHNDLILFWQTMKWVSFSISVFFPYKVKKVRIVYSFIGRSIDTFLPLGISVAFIQSFHTRLVLKIPKQLFELQG